MATIRFIHEDLEVQCNPGKFKGIGNEKKTYNFMDWKVF